MASSNPSTSTPVSIRLHGPIALSGNMTIDLAEPLANGAVKIGEGKKGRTMPLSIWDQSTSRFHVKIVACFQLSNCRRGETEAHLRKSIKQLSKGRPDLAGTVHLGERFGWVYHTQHPDYEIQFESRCIADEFPHTYVQLQEMGFPAAAFVHKRYGFAGDIRDYGDVAPVAGIRAYFIDGGLILSINFHHTFGDGELLLDFLEVLAAATRGNITAKRGSRDLGFTKAYNSNGCSLKSSSFEELMQQCPEFTIVNDQSGPNQPTPLAGGTHEMDYDRDGRIFVFSDDSIKKMKSLVAYHAPAEAPPSTYTCLATLLWVFSAKARCKHEECLPTWNKDDTATMSNPVNWRYRAFKGQCKDYFGNAVALAQTHVSKKEVLAACSDDATLARLVRKVEAGIQAVDNKYVRDRIHLIEACPDPRILGLKIDGRIPQDLAFNTWRAFGADTEWDLCGDGDVRKPDTLRRAQPFWNMGGTLIMPARKDSTDYEVLLTIPRKAMDEIAMDEAFLKWATRVIE